MERDLRRIQKQIISKERAKSCTARKIECCIIDKKTVWLKEHKTKEKYLIEKKAYITLCNEDFLPKLIYYDDKNYILCISDVGDVINVYRRKNRNHSINVKENIDKMIEIMYNKYGLVHGDIKDKNICVDSNNKVRLIDFDRTKKADMSI